MPFIEGTRSFIKNKQNSDVSSNYSTVSETVSLITATHPAQTNSIISNEGSRGKFHLSSSLKQNNSNQERGVGFYMTMWRFQRVFYIKRIKHTRAFIQREKSATRYFLVGEKKKKKKAFYIPVCMRVCVCVCVRTI